MLSFYLHELLLILESMQYDSANGPFKIRLLLLIYHTTAYSEIISPTIVKKNWF